MTALAVSALSGGLFLDQPVTTAQAARKTSSSKVTVKKAATKKTTTKKKKKVVKKHHYIFVMGHGAGDPGARGNGTSEATYLRKHLMPKLKKYAKHVKKSTVTFYNPKHNIVKDTLVYHRGSYKISKKNTTVIMFHLDASTSSRAHGGHVIIHKRKPNARDARIRSVIKKYVGLNRSNGGYSYRTNLRNCNVLRRRGVDYDLIETGFITNHSDYKHINKHLNKIAKGYVTAITHEKIK
ncbi:N-acetylmuramoyl-L-alanine amidase [Lactiplantibacillus garii]|uniref:N-acetylmuramoyl-L-alanine amidase n=2 Tax=Lactiplantibacillus garii TaxID=2306423 RepID=A0A3R8J7L8_9LACO|nr:N-acetylmuramoyl-L-alanine amidase [Lactiplantibacillus garii]